MATRAADATIKGYYYQFDTSILNLLTLPNDPDSIVVEGIEDIDVHTASDLTTVQCKYLSKPKFINSAVRDPIILMLDHFRNPATPNTYKYVLYAHFENEMPGKEPSIDITRLKEILTYKKDGVDKQHHVDNGISDTTLNTFLVQFKFVFGKEFYSQQNEVIGKLKTRFACSDFEADTFFYNNSLRIILDRAIKPDETQRKITKKQFLDAIDCRKRLFSDWYIQIRSKKEYLQLGARQLKSTKALDPIRPKIIVIGNDLISADNTELPLLSFIELLISKYYKLGSALRNAKSLTIVLDCDETLLKNTKKLLIENTIAFNDGYEDILFSSEMFNRDPIINVSSSANKISKASFVIRLISKQTFLNNMSSISIPKVLFNFSKDDIVHPFSDTQFFEFKYCANLKEASKLLVP